MEIRQDMTAALLRCLKPVLGKCLEAAATSQGDFAVVEKAVGAAMSAVRRAVVSTALGECAAAYSVEWNCPDCGARLTRHGDRWRAVVTAEGEGRYRSTRYRCTRCSRDRYPLETANGLVSGQYTTMAKGVIATAGAEMPYEAAASAVAVRGIPVSPKQVDRICRDVARWRQQEEERAIARAEVLRQNDTDERITELHQWPGWDALTPALVSLDGGKIRSTVMGRDGLEWFEARIGIIGSAVEKVRFPKIYVGGVKDPDEIFRRLYAAWRSDPRPGRPIIFCADGAEWIWRRVSLYFPHAWQLLDIFHASQHVGTAAAAGWGPDSKRHRKWVKQARRMLLTPHGPTRIRRILAAQLNHGNPHDAEALARELAYLDDHRDRMTYCDFRRKGFIVGSGAMESAVKQTSTERLRLPGMMWSRSGADHMLTLRASLLSGDLPSTLRRVHAYRMSQAQLFAPTSGHTVN